MKLRLPLLEDTILIAVPDSNQCRHTQFWPDAFLPKIAFFEGKSRALQVAAIQSLRNYQYCQKNQSRKFRFINTNLSLGGLYVVPRLLRRPMYIRRDLDILGFRSVKPFMMFCVVAVFWYMSCYTYKFHTPEGFRFHGNCTEQ